MTGFLGLRIFIDRSQRITLHDMSPSLLDLHLNEFADVVIFVGTKALILYFGKSFRALVVPESVEEGRVESCAFSSLSQSPSSNYACSGFEESFSLHFALRCK